MLTEDDDDDDCLLGIDALNMQRQKSKTEYQRRESFHFYRGLCHGVIEEKPF